jgi:aldehyde:ferredoxin oxidoreductase
LSVAGSNCGISDLSAITFFNEECSNYGVDTISAGNIIAWAMELYERGILNKDQTGGLDLRFGNIDAYVEMPRIIALRQGLGNTLAEGVREAARLIGKGSERFTLEVKGLEYPGYDPRGSVAMALAYALSDRGACHMRAWPVKYEAFGRLDRFTPDGKAEITLRDHFEKAVRWSLCACDFADYKPDVMADLLSASMGKTVAVDDLMAIGKRIWTLTRMLNAKEGFGRKDDTLPLRIANDPLLGGPTDGRTLNSLDFEKMLTDYYSLAGWDEHGIPTVGTLTDVGLRDLLQGEALASA